LRGGIRKKKQGRIILIHICPFVYIPRILPLLLSTQSRGTPSCKKRWNNTTKGKEIGKVFASSEIYDFHITSLPFPFEDTRNFYNR
jgi:hypothetical protein